MRTHRCPPSERKYRTLTQEFFRRLCAEAGGVSDPAMLLDYLHHAGIVFYRKGLFDDRIVLDQAWALEAVYAVFHGRSATASCGSSAAGSTGTLLEALVWSEYSVEEQELFLSLMTSCGICFVHREGDREGRARDGIHRPRPAARTGRTVAAEIEAMWGERAPGEELVVELPFLHPGVMRGIISRIGQAAGISAVYWKYGVCLYESTTRSRALIEQHVGREPHHLERPDRGPDPGRPGRGAAPTAPGVDQAARSSESGCRGCDIAERRPAGPPGNPAKPGRRARGRRRAAPNGRCEFTPPPSEASDLLRLLRLERREQGGGRSALRGGRGRRGIQILRDKTGLGLGESITRFMQKLGAGDRVFVILSDKYLKSPYCMYELLEVWRNCKQEDEEFRRPHPGLPPAGRRDADARSIACGAPATGESSSRELDALVREHGADLLGEADFKRYKLMQDFAHRVGDILALIADTLQPRGLRPVNGPRLRRRGPFVVTRPHQYFY